MEKIYQYKNNVITTIQKNKRRINAYIRQSKIRRIKVYIILFCMLFTSLNSVFALENENIYYGEYKIQCFKDPYMYIKYNGVMQANYEYYYIKDGAEYPVYCLNLGLKGAEDNYNGYIVNGDKKITDEKLQLIILNSYPYKSVEELGLNNIHEAKFASQFAIWCYLENLNLDLIEPISDMNIKLVETIKEIYNCINGDINQKSVDIEFSVNSQNLEKIENEVYYTREFLVTNKKNIIKVDVLSTDSKARVIKLSDDKYKVCVPVEIVKDDYKVNLKVNVSAKENVALFGKTTIDGYQDVAITLKDNFDLNLEETILFNKYETNIKIVKKDKDTNDTLEGIKYGIYDKDNNILGEYLTDKNGVIDFSLFYPSKEKIYIKELDTKDEYKLDSNVYEYIIEPNTSLNLEYFNEKKKGYIEIIKKSKEYNELTKLPENSPLKDVCFEILDENYNVVDKLKTDEYGYAKSEALPLGKYYIKETQTNKHYKIMDKVIEVNIIKENDEVNVQILNDNVTIEEKLPVTGR